MSEHTDISKWTIGITADNTSGVAARSAVSGRTHYVTSLSASFSTTNLKLLTLGDGTTTLSWYVYDHVELSWPKPLKFVQGAAVTATLAATGTGGQIGTVVLTGFTIGA